MDSLVKQNAAEELAGMLGRAFLTAHLISGNPECAERAVLKAIERWNPDEDQDQLIRLAINYVVDSETLRAHTGVAELYLADELRAVLRLDPGGRSCFVLRNLIGLPEVDCARLLRLLPGEVAERNLSALRQLASS